MDEKEEARKVPTWLLLDMLRQAAMKGVDQAIEDYREHGDPGEVDSWDMAGGIADDVLAEYAHALPPSWATPAPAEGE